MVQVMQPGLERRLKAHVAGDVLFDPFSRGRYATDASHYQMMPAGVVVPRSMDGAVAALQIAREEGVPVTARGGGTSQCGQTVNSGLIIDGSKYLNRILSLDVEGRKVTVEPGIVLDDLNRQLKKHGLWFPVDVSTASRATIGGMTANNSCGGRSIRYGTMRANVLAIDAVLADGAHVHLGEVSPDLSDVGVAERALANKLLAIGAREAAEVEARFPKVHRRVGGYNLDALNPRNNRINLAHILVGSEGTLAYSTAITLQAVAGAGQARAGGLPFRLLPCRDGCGPASGDAQAHRGRAGGRHHAGAGGGNPHVPRHPGRDAAGKPEAILLVEFDSGEEENARRMKQLLQMMGDLGFDFSHEGAKWGGVVEVYDPALQNAITELRKSGLNIMMSMKDQRKPISFVEDCAVPLEHLAEYTARLTDCFERHGTRGTWYAHASEGCLHVRPVLNLRQEKDVKAMRAIAEEAFEMVRQYKGSHSGEHGDGLVRSEFHQEMFGPRLVKAFEEVKDVFDPKGLMNPGKIVRAPKFDERDLFRYAPDYEVRDFQPALDWSEYPGAIGGFQGAAEQCNNNGACRKSEGGAMCPSYRATRDEQHVTRGRANSLRLALSGQLGEGAFTSDEMLETHEALRLLQGLQARMPHGRGHGADEDRGAGGADEGTRAVAARPADRRPAALCAAGGEICAAAEPAQQIAALRRLSETLAGFSAERDLPLWRRDRFDHAGESFGPETGHEVVLWADSFNAAFEREILDDALKTLTVAGYRVHVAKPADGSSRPLCCGRTHLAVGDVERRQGRDDAHAWPRWSHSSPAACRWWDWSQAACSPSATKRRPCCRVRTANAPPPMPCCSRNSSSAKPRPAASSPRSNPRAGRPCCMAIAIRRPLARWARWKRRSA